MIIIEFFQAFILPSVFIFILFLTGIFFLIFKKKKIAIWFLGISLFFYYFFSITPVADFLLLPLERKYSYPSWEAIEKPKFVVVLSGGVKGKRLSLPSVLGDSTLFRLNEAFKIYSLRKNKPKIIVSGTSPIDQYSKEALFGADFLELFGVPKENISFEVLSSDTFEHAIELKKILGNNQFLLVTSAYHLPRALRAFHKNGLFPIPVPTDYQVEGSYNILDFLPQPKNLRKANIAFHEYFGIIYYKLFK